MSSDEDLLTPLQRGEDYYPETDLSEALSLSEDVKSASDRSRSHSVESILTAKSFARNIPGLVQSLSDQEKTLPLHVSLIKCITQRILDEVMPSPSEQRPVCSHNIQLVVPGAVSSPESKKRYMVIMGCSVFEPALDEEINEHVILGINIGNNTTCPQIACVNHKESPSGCQGDITVAMAMPVSKGVSIEMDGDGGIKIKGYQSGVHYIFKPVNLQALWVAYNYLNDDIQNARRYNYFPGSKNHHTWAGCYTTKVPDYFEAEDEWEDNSLIENQITKLDFKDEKMKRLMERILIRMREIIMVIDLDNANCLEIRVQLEMEFNVNLTPYKQFINEQIVSMFGQLSNAPSKIFDYLYLGNEWNASNLVQLKSLGVTHVLNVTMEIANFFSHELIYKTIRIQDEEGRNLQQYWDDTYMFIKDAKSRNKKVYVHCRMGVSRSASCVIAYIMKEYSMSLSVAYEYVKKIRSCVNPNPGFTKQLMEYNGILEARYNNTYGILAKRRLARCPQISEQKLITERWLKEYGNGDECLSNGTGTEDEVSSPPAVVREMDGNEKVSEWMDKNNLSQSPQDPPSPIADLDHRVLQHDLLNQLKKNEDGSIVRSDQGELSDVITACDDATDNASTTPDNTMTTAESVSPTTDPDQDTTMCDDVTRSCDDVTRSCDDVTRSCDDVTRSRDDVTRSLDDVTRSRDELSADGPYSPERLEQEIEAVAGGVLSDSEMQTKVKEAVAHKIRSNPSLRRSTTGSSVRNHVLKLEVQNEAENWNTVEYTRDRVRSAGSVHTSKRTNKKIKQTQSWADYTSNNNLEARPQTRKHKKDHTKLRTGGQRICASIKKIIERLLSPRPDKQTHKQSASDEIEIVAEREGKIYDKSKSNRMSMPIIPNSDVVGAPKRRCHSGTDLFQSGVRLDPTLACGT